MKASELMIGDYVIFHDNGWNSDGTDWEEDLIAQVCETGETLLTLRIDGEEVYNLDIERCSPILLSREILLKNGFGYRESTGAFFTYADECYANQQVTVIIFNVENPYRNVQLHIEETYNPQETILHLMACNHVHELQHALRLCGIEKEIEK